MKEFSPVLTSPALSATNLRAMIKAYHLTFDCYQLLGKGYLDEQEDQVTMKYLSKVYKTLSNIGDIPQRVLYVEQLIRELVLLKRWLYTRMHTDVQTPVLVSSSVGDWFANAPTEPKLHTFPPMLHLPDQRAPRRKGKAE